MEIMREITGAYHNGHMGITHRGYSGALFAPINKRYPTPPSPPSL